MPHARIEPQQAGDAGKTPIGGSGEDAGLLEAEPVVPQAQIANQSQAAPATEPPKDNLWKKIKKQATAPLFRKKKTRSVEVKSFSAEVPLRGLKPAKLLVTYDVDTPHTL